MSKFKFGDIITAKVEAEQWKVKNRYCGLVTEVGSTDYYKVYWYEIGRSSFPWAANLESDYE